MVKIIRRLLMKIRMKRNANAFYKGVEEGCNDINKYCFNDIIATTEACARILELTDISDTQK